MQNKHIRLMLLFLILGIAFSLTFGAKSCANRNKKTRAGSSNEWAGIAAPSSLTATAISYAQINLNWQDNSNNNDGFAIERSSGGPTAYTVITTVGADTTFYSDQEVLPTVLYYYRIRAFNTIGDYSNYSNEVSISTLNLLSSSIVEIAAGGEHNTALTNNGEMFGWGSNSYNQLGLGAYAPFTITISTQIGTETNWSKIATGDYNSFGIKTDNSLWAWGNNEFGQLGLGYTSLTQDFPMTVGTGVDWDLIRCGANHTLALKTNGTLWSCGLNENGQLGLGDSGIGTERFSFTQVGIDSDWSNVTAGSTHSIAQKTNGTIWG